MADKYNDKTKKYDELHSKRLASIERKIKAAYKKAAEDASKLATAPHLSSKKTYKLDDYPQAKKQADRILEELKESVETIIVNGIESEWTLANNKNNELSQIVFGDNVGSLSDEMYQRYFSNNHEALQAFIARKQAGLNLSDRVWKYTGAFKDEIETAIDLGIRSGKSAAEISRDVRSYLQNPDKLFRKVKDEYGKLHLSKAAKAYHPGAGVYRSSYMNARRLAVTETNIAYRTSDYMRQQQLDFIVGIRIVLSNNHNCKGVPAGMFFDICDSLQGNYPKDFKFTGWHPHCRCHVETILKTPEELEKDTERILAGRQTTNTSKNKIKDVPKAFKEWVKDNEDRIMSADERTKLPYFILDNKDKVNQMLGKQLNSSLPTPTPKAAQKAIPPKWYNTPETADAALRDMAGSTWNSLSEVQKDSLEEYTGDGYAMINRVLRNQPLKTWTPQQINAAKKHAENIEKAIEQSELTSGIWVQRVETMDGLSKFGIKNAYSMSEKDMMKLVGKTGTEDAFMSTCVVKGRARMIEGDFDIIYDIKVPQGSKALYTEPFSTYGAGAGRKWDGISAQKQIGSEAELLLQKGSTFKITKVWKDEDGFWRIEMELQPKTQKVKTIQERAAERHAARTPEQQKAIIDAWNKRKEQYAAIEKEGKQMDALFKDISDVDTKALEKALKKYDLKTVKTEAAKLKKIKDELESCEWIENPMEMAKSFSAKAVRETEKDFVFRMDLWQKKYKYGKFTDAPLEHQKAKLQWELTDEIAAGKYKHPDLAMKALQKKLDDVQDKLEFEEFAAVQEEFKQFQKLHKSSVLDKQIKELDNAIKAHDKISVKKAISELEETQKKLEATVKKAKPAPKVNLKSPNKNVSIQSNENTVNNFIAGGNKPYSRYSKEATDYVIANSNVVRNTFMEFAKTKEGLVFEKAELEALAKATSKEMLDAEVRKLRNKYWRNTSEVRKVSELVDEVYKECEMQARSVNNFTYQWDYEIRQFQRGKAVKSYHGHTKAEIKERAESVERFIACAPKWKGGDTFRGMSLSNEELEALIKDMKDGQGDMLGTASWSSLQKVSQGFASRHLGEFDVNGNEKTVRVLLKAKSHKRATPIMHLSEFSHEAEILSSQYERWKFVKMTKKIINGDEFTIIEVEPV